MRPRASRRARVTREWVKIAWGAGSTDSIMAWIVYPKTSGKAPVVVVVHEIFGLSTWVRGVADQVAADGFIAIAPDFLSRVRGGPTTDELRGDSAQKLIRGVQDGRPGSRDRRSRELRDDAAVRRAEVRGHRLLLGRFRDVEPRDQRRRDGLLGRRRVLRHAVHVAGHAGDGDDAGGPGALIADSMAKISKPVMLLSGSKDARITALMPAIDSAMKAMHKPYDYRTTKAPITDSFARRTTQKTSTRRRAPEEAANLAA